MKLSCGYLPAVALTDPAAGNVLEWLKHQRVQRGGKARALVARRASPSPLQPASMPSLRQKVWTQKEEPKQPSSAFDVDNQVTWQQHAVPRDKVRRDRHQLSRSPDVRRMRRPWSSSSTAMALRGQIAARYGPLKRYVEHLGSPSRTWSSTRSRGSSTSAVMLKGSRTGQFG